MAGDKRKQQYSGSRGGRSGGGGGGGNEARQAKRRKYAAAAKGGGGKGAAGGQIQGPGLWLSCVRRKEAISTSEAYDLLNSVADRLYPETSKQGAERNRNGNGANNHDESALANSNEISIDNGEKLAHEEGEEDDIEAQIAKELEDLQPQTDPKTGKRVMRFQSVRTDTECLIWIGCQPPCDPVKLTYAIAEDLQSGAPVRTRFLQRITPVSNTTHADSNSLKSLAYKILQPIIAPTGYTSEQSKADEPIKYRIEPFLRNHTGTLDRQVVLDVVGEVIRDLANPFFQLKRGEKPVDKAESEEKPVETAVEEANNMQGVTSETDGAPIREEKQETAGAAGTEESLTEKQSISEETMKQQESGADEPSKELEIMDSDKNEDPSQLWYILPEHRRRTIVDLKHPTHTILVSALRGVCGLSVVERYEENKKYNIQSLGSHSAENTPASRTTKQLDQQPLALSQPDTIDGVNAKEASGAEPEAEENSMDKAKEADNEITVA